MDDPQKFLMRRYLLGELDEASREQVEERFFSDPEYHAELLGIEEELVGDYLANNLSAGERDMFGKHYLATPQKVQSVQVTAALLRYCSTAETAKPQMEESAPPKGKTRDPRRSVWIWRFAYAAVVIVALILASVTMVLILRQRRGATDGDVIRELIALNRPDAAGKTPDATITLLPVNLRAGGDSSNFRPRPGIDVIQMVLVLPRDDYPAYTIVIQRSNDPKPITIDHLSSTVTGAGKVVLLKVPARLVSPQVYTFEVKGLAPNGAVESVADYTLKVQP